MFGPTRTGKTILARSLGRHSYFNNTFNLDTFDNDCEYAVFDDISGGLKSIPYKQWLGGQLQFTTSDKYRRKKDIIWGRPSIYIANDNPLLERGIDRCWLVGNTTIVEISSTLVDFTT
jgi:hypothetical protein